MFEHHCLAKGGLKLAVIFPKITVTVYWSQEPIICTNMGVSSQRQYPNSLRRLINSCGGVRNK